MEPDELLQAERLAEEQGLEVLGFYHSHPDHPATPSGYDLKHAWPFYSYLIVAVKEGAAGELSGWELAPDRSVFLAKRLCGAAKNL
jgi:proteasome lid subunit RPN8/RPN11